MWRKKQNLFENEIEITKKFYTMCQFQNFGFDIAVAFKISGSLLKSLLSELITPTPKF